MAKVHPTNIAIGKNKGHLTTKFKLPEKKTKIIRQSRKKGVLPKRVAFIRSIISEIAGNSVYEKRALELLKSGAAKDSKKALKITKKAIGTHRRANMKRRNLVNQLRAARKK